MYNSKPNSSNSNRDNPYKKLLFFGIDSATWDLILPWVSQGKLPGFAKFIKLGLKIDLYSTTPPLTPIAWTTLYTGTNPGKHGIFDFYKLDKTKKLNVYTAQDGQLPSLFYLLSKAGLKVCSLNMPFTYPAEPVNGIMLSGFMTPGFNTDFIYPKALKPKFMQKFPNYEFTEKTRFGLTKSSQEVFFNNIKKSIEQKIKVFDWLETQADWNFFAFNFMEVDHVQHWYWQDKAKLLQIYQMIDRYLLKKISAKKYNHYLLFSDHGAGQYERNVNLNTLLMQKDLLVLKKDMKTQFKRLLFHLGINPNTAIKIALFFNMLPSSSAGKSQTQKIKLFLNMEDIDWECSTAYSFGYYGSIFMIKKDKQSRTKVIQVLKALKYKGKKVMNQVWYKSEVYSGKYLKQAPDILFSPREYAFGSSAVAPFLSNQIFSKPHTLKTGEHRFKGILGIYPKVKVEKKAQYKIPDLTATILDYFQIPIPKYFDGKSLLRRPSKIIEEIKI